MTTQCLPLCLVTGATPVCVDVQPETGLAPSRVSLIESARHVPTLETLERIAGGLGVPLYRFFLTDEQAAKLGKK